MVKGLLQDKKVPGTSAGTSSPRPTPAGPAAGFLGETRAKGSLHCQTRLEQHHERPGCLKLQRQEERRSGKPMETVGAGWGELRVGLYETLTWTVPGLAGEVGCVREQALHSMEGASGLSRRIFSKRKRPSGSLWGIPLQQQLQSPLQLATCPSGE